MVDRYSDGFKIGRTGNEKENTEEAIHEEILEQRVEKLGQRVTLIAILIPVLVGVIFAIAYLDIKKRVFNMHDTGVEKLTKLSEELESKFSSLSIRFAGLEENFNQREKSLNELEESFTKKIVPMEEIFLSMESANNAMKQKLDEVEKQVEKATAKNASEIQAIREKTFDKKELSSQFVVIDEALATLQEDVRTVSSQVEQIDRNFRKELKSLTEYLAKEKTRLDQAIKATENLSGVVAEFRSEYKDFAKGTTGFVSDEELPLQVEKARLKLKVALDEAVRRMENRVDDLERRLEAGSKVGSAPSSPSGSDGIIERNLQ